MTHEHTRSAPRGVWDWFTTIFHLNGHCYEHEALSVDPAFNGNKEAIRTVWLALLALGITSIIQIGIGAFSGSVARLADTIHNIGNTLNSIPLLIAFYLARRLATHRYTYSFGRAEDVAGILIVLSIYLRILERVIPYLELENFHQLFETICKFDANSAVAEAIQILAPYLNAIDVASAVAVAMRETIPS